MRIEDILFRDAGKVEGKTRLSQVLEMAPMPSIPKLPPGGEIIFLDLLHPGNANLLIRLSLVFQKGQQVPTVNDVTKTLAGFFRVLDPDNLEVSTHRMRSAFIGEPSKEVKAEMEKHQKEIRAEVEKQQSEQLEEEYS